MSKATGTPFYKGMLNFGLNATFTALWFIFGLVPMDTCLSACGPLTPNQLNSKKYECSWRSPLTLDSSTSPLTVIYPDVDPVAYPDFDATKEGYINVTKWFRIICGAAFLAYIFASLGSLGYCFQKAGQRFASLEVYSRYVIYLVFIASHVIRFSHEGRVCAGDFVDSATTDWSLYLYPTGSWLLTYIIWVGSLCQLF